MNQGKRTIVVAIRDQSSGRRALQRALRLGRKALDEVHLIHVRRQPVLARLLPSTRRTDVNAGPESADPIDWLQDLASETRVDGWEVRHATLEGPVATRVAGYAREVEADFLVVASPRRGLARELFLGSSALRILRSANRPVLVVRNDPALPYGRALVAINQDAVAARIVELSAALLGDVAIDLAHAYKLPEEYEWRRRGATEQTIADNYLARQSGVEHELDDLRQKLPRAIVHVEPGFAPSVILGLFDRLTPDIIVVGKHEGTAVAEQLIGSVPQFLLYACETDFLLVP